MNAGLPLFGRLSHECGVRFGRSGLAVPSRQERFLRASARVEIWYGHVFDADYTTSTNVRVDQASTDSLVGRAGFRLGPQCPNNRGSAFLKASVLHDWEGEADFRFSKGGAVSRTLTEDLGGTRSSTGWAPTSTRAARSISGLSSNAATAAKSIPTTAPRSACAARGSKAAAPQRGGYPRCGPPKEKLRGRFPSSAEQPSSFPTSIRRFGREPSLIGVPSVR